MRSMNSDPVSNETPVEIGRFEEINNQNHASIVQDNERHFDENRIT